MNIRQWWRFLLLVIASPVACTPGNDFVISHATTMVHNDEYRLNVQVEYTFSKAILEALDNGVAVTIDMHIQVRPDTTWIAFWQETLVNFTLRSSINYQPLTELYTVTHLPNGPKKIFVTRAAAIAALGEIEALPLIKISLLNQNIRYFVHLKVAIDLEALPLPLRPIAYFTPSWNLSSGWSKWSLAP